MQYAEVHLPVPLHQGFTYAVPHGMEVLFGHKVRVPFGKSMKTGFVISITDSKPGHLKIIKNIDRIMVAKPLFDTSFLTLAMWVSTMYFCSLGEALDAMIPGGIRPKELEDEALLLVDDDESISGTQRFQLSLEQEKALEEIRSSDRKLLYLFGKTGSGKTEVFLQAAETVLTKGRSVIYLVPEIALTSQVIQDIKQRFAEKSAIIHSRLTPSQRLGEWFRIFSGDALLIVGARSAVFAPVKNLGLIILDEEHEGSYKSGNAPRYHARQVAMHRVAATEGMLIMGSATPSVEAWELMQHGRIQKLLLPNRVSGGKMPEVRVSAVAGLDGAIGPELAAEIRATKTLGAQTILFLNRRGFSYFFNCRSCGYELVCSHCSVSMTYHKHRDRVMCHHCGRSQPAPRICPSCKGYDVGYAGFGTEFVEDEVRKLFPDLRIARIDTDTIKRKGQLEDTLNAFKQGEIDILLGTQMVAKGLNVKGLRLAGLILADGALHMPDFRAAERTFNLLVQVAGRAGRFRDDGLVIVQAIRPEHAVIQLASKLDLVSFYEQELSHRKELGFPPFSRIIRLVFRSIKVDKALQAAREFLLLRRKPLASVAEVLGPSECPLSQVNGNWRFHIIMTTLNFQGLHAALAAVLKDYTSPSSVYLEIDVDPVSML